MINPVAAVTRLRVMGPAYFPTGIRERIPRPRSRVLLVAAIVFFVVSNAFNVFLGYLIVNGSLDDKWYDFRDLGIGMRELTAWLDTQNASLPSGFDSVGFLGDHWVAQDSQSADLHLHHVTRLEPDRGRTRRADASRGSSQQDRAGQQRHSPR